MSSPLSMLKKGSARNVPFRNHSFTPDEKLLEDVVNSQVKEKTDLNRDITDFTLMQSMMDRIQQLEKQVSSQAREIVDKDRLINKYEEKLSQMQSTNESSNNQKKNSELQAQCFILRKQVEQMEEFLADYGLIWVGDSDEEENNELPAFPHGNQSHILTSRTTSYWSQEASLNNTTETHNFVPNFEKLLTNIKELNILAGEGQSKVFTDADKKEARLKTTEAIPLGVFKNGIVLFEGPFRPYTDQQTRQFIVDIMDGYFPSELEKMYPDGVPFRVTDRREAVFKDKINEIFTGEGRRLTSADSVVNSRPITTTSNEMKLESGKVLSEEQFLGKLPKNIVKNGKIMDIRQGIAETLHSSAHSTHPNQREHSAVKFELVETKLVKELRERLSSSTTESLLSKGRPTTPRGGGLLVTLRIRSENGSRTYILKLGPNETIGDVRNYLNSHRKLKSGNTNQLDSNYDIVQNFPTHVIFEDSSATLEHCGLMANAALYLKRRSSNDIEKNNLSPLPDKESSIKLLSFSTKNVQTS